MAVVKHGLSGEDGTKRIVGAFAVHKREMSQWLAACQKHRINGIAWKNGRYSVEFKLHVVPVVQSEFLPFREAAVWFNISDHNVAGRRVRAYEASDDEDLLNLRLDLRLNLRKAAKNSVKKAGRIATPLPRSSSKSAEALNTVYH